MKGGARSTSLGMEPSAGEREGRSPRMKEPSAGEREGRAPRMKEPSAGEREGRAPRMKEPTRTVWNLLLALGSLVVGLSLCEAALRMLHPRYEYAARSPQRTYYWHSEYPHPDTGAKHRVAYNNLGSRQHRNFNERDLAEGVNLAFFGDSYTENLRMPAHHSFTEILDYLLNGNGGGGRGSSMRGERPSRSPAEGSSMRGERPSRSPAEGSLDANFNVLNFGIEDTGPVEQYSLWSSLRVKRRLRHVFYVHMTNDIKNVRRSHERGASPAGRAPWQAERSRAWIRALSGFHLTYLALDAWRRLDDGAAQRLSSMSESEALAAFESVLRRWRREVEAAGGEFHIVLLPTPEGDRWFRRLESPSSWNVVDLPRCFNEAIPNYDYADWRFANDEHWNEAANMVAARCLYRDLEDLLDLPERGDAQLARALHGYYAAFHDRDRFGGEAGWMPPLQPLQVGVAVPLADSEADRIVARYQSLDQDGDTYRPRVVDAARTRYRQYWAIAETEPVARSVWDVHALRERREVAVLKAPCTLTDLMAGYFILRAFPQQYVKGGVYTERFYIDNTFSFPSIHGPMRGPMRFDDRCLLIVRLPEGVGAVEVGEYERETRALSWQVRFYWDMDGLRRAHAAVSGRRPDAAGAFEVYWREDALVYVREPCAEADTRQRFFLHVYAARSEGGDDRRANLDFDFVYRGALFDGKCVALVALPEAVPGGGPVVRLRTGQFSSAGETWAVELVET